MKFKGIERAFKRGAFGVAAALSRGRTNAHPDWGSRAHRVLFLRYDRIGDMLIATPIIRAIAAAYPTLAVDVLASPSNRSVLEGNPHVRRVHVFDRRSPSSFVQTVRTLRGERYDAVISGMLKPSGTTSTLMLGSGADCTIGIANNANAYAYTLPIAPVSTGELFVRQLGEVVRAFDVDPEITDWHYDFFLRDDERQRGESLWNEHAGTPRVLVNVSAFTEDRRWPTERYVAVVQHLRERYAGACVLITGDPRDWSTVEMIAASAGVPAVNVSPIRNAFAFVGAADVVITPDTSIAHAAAAEGIPCVIMFRAGSEMFAPPGDNNECIVSGGTLAELPVELVIAAVDRLLARR